jgi:hypothetical protein
MSTRNPNALYVVVCSHTHAYFQRGAIVRPCPEKIRNPENAIYRLARGAGEELFDCAFPLFATLIPWACVVEYQPEATADLHARHAETLKETPT